jgi:predicted NBD/HSP70 family sugar kinase
VDELNGRSKWVDELQPLSMDWPCSCGQKGHLGALASGTAWTRRMEESNIEVPPLIEGVRRGDVSHTEEALTDIVDPRIAYALEDIGRLVGRSLTAPILLLDPHSLTLTGSFAIGPVRDGIISERETWRHVFGDALDIDLFASDSAKYVGVRGAALAVIRHNIYRRFDEHLQTPSIGRGLAFSL